MLQGSEVRKVPGVPPRPVLTIVLAVRNFLNALVRKMAPPPVAMAEFIFGFMNAPMVGAACRLGVADQLAAKGPMTVAELARATGASEVSLARLMRALVSVGVFEHGADGKLRLNGMAQTLRANVPGSMRELALTVNDKWHVDAWGSFGEVVRTGKNGVELHYHKGVFELLEGTDEGKRLDGAMTALTQLDAPAHARNYDFSGVKKVCEVGGGHGTLLAHLLAQNGHLKGILFDLPKVVANAGPLLEAWGVKDRVECVGGSFFDAVPTGCELYVMRSVLHDWDDENCVKIIKKVKEAMAPSAKLLVIEQALAEDDAPSPGKMLDLQMMAISPQGMERTGAQYASLLSQGGLKLLRAIPTSSPYMIYEAGHPNQA